MHGQNTEREGRAIELEELENLKSEILEVREQEQPPRTMKELENRIFQAGEEWRTEHTETKVNESTGDVTEKVAMPQTFTVAKILSDIVTFTFISKSNIPDYSLLYNYDLDEGIYTASNDLFNLFCKTFDVRIKPREWPQIKLMVRTLTKIRKPLESDNLVPVQNGIINLETKELRNYSPLVLSMSLQAR